MDKYVYVITDERFLIQFIYKDEKFAQRKCMEFNKHQKDKFKVIKFILISEDKG